MNPYESPQSEPSPSVRYRPAVIDTIIERLCDLPPVATLLLVIIDFVVLLDKLTPVIQRGNRALAVLFDVNVRNAPTPTWDELSWFNAFCVLGIISFTGGLVLLDHLLVWMFGHPLPKPHPEEPTQPPPA